MLKESSPTRITQCDGTPWQIEDSSLGKGAILLASHTVDTNNWVGSCDIYLRRKSQTKRKAPLVNIQSSYPFDLVSTDFSIVDECAGGVRNVLIIADNFTTLQLSYDTIFVRICTVLVKILAFSEPHKISDKFEQKMYKVVDQPHQDIPVYIVRSKDGTEKKLHRNYIVM